jgi:hypothetical protein
MLCKARAAALVSCESEQTLTAQSGEMIETHGPYQHGSGFKTVNAPNPALQPFPANVPPSASNESVGVSYPGHFASEFGCRCCLSRFFSVIWLLYPRNTRAFAVASCCFCYIQYVTAMQCDVVV